MKTLKKQFKQENVDSNDILTIITNYSHKDKVRIALYCAEDCFHHDPIKKSQTCIDLVKSWLKDKKTATEKELKIAAAAYVSNAVAAAVASAYYATAATDAVDAAYWAECAFRKAARYFGYNSEKEKSKREEYKNYARLFAYEDLSFPYENISKTFDLDNPTDLNIFLDFLTDHYPEAITYPREEYFTNKLAKEYLKVIYQ